MTKFRIKFHKLINKHGKKRGWVSDKMGMYRMEFWRKMNKDEFTEAQKNKIIKIITQ